MDTQQHTAEANAQGGFVPPHLDTQSRTPARPTLVIDSEPSEPFVIKDSDTEKKRESERRAWFQNAANEKLHIPTGYHKVAVLIVRWCEDLDEFRTGHDEEVCIMVIFEMIYTKYK